MKNLEKSKTYNKWLKVIDRVDDLDELLADFFQVNDYSKVDRISAFINYLKYELDQFSRSYERSKSLGQKEEYRKRRQIRKQ